MCALGSERRLSIPDEEAESILVEPEDARRFCVCASHRNRKLKNPIGSPGQENSIASVQERVSISQSVSPGNVY